jgi:hypothetical protein
MSLSTIPPISVFFNKFWPGFAEKTDVMDCTFFVQLLEKTYSAPIQVVYSPENASILVESIFGNYSYLNYKKWWATILFTGEPEYFNTPNIDKYDCVLGFEDTHDKFVRCPLFIIYLLTNQDIRKEIENVERPVPHINDIPPNHASIIVSNAYHGKERIDFFNLVNETITVFSGGKYANNVGGVVPGSYNSNEMVEFYKKGKFAITMENSNKSYYITEKLVNGIRSGVVPVYWGTPNVVEFFNPRRFMQLAPTPTKDDMFRLIDKMKTMTDQEYLNIIQEPVLVQSIDSIFNGIVESVKKILT